MSQGDRREHNWVPLYEFVRQHPEVESDLLHWVLTFMVKDATLASRTTPTEEVLIRVDQAEAVVKKLDRSQWPEMEGRKLSVREAAREYGLSATSLTNLLREGHLQAVGQDKTGYRVYLSAADVALVATLKQLIGRRGRPLFPPR